MILSRTMAFLAAFLFAAAPSQAQTGIMLPIYVNGQVNPSMAAFLAGLSPGFVPNSALAPAASPTIKSNISGGSASPSDNSPSSIWDSLCGTAVGQFWVRQTGGWGCTSLGYANPVWWGADPGASDNSSAFNSALAASQTVAFPAGTFKMASAISYSIPAGITSVAIKGRGQDITNLTWPNVSGGLTINYNSTTSSAHIRDLSLTTSQVGSGTALTLALASSVANPANTAVSDVYRVTIRGADGWAATDYWSNAISVNNVSNIQFDDISLIGSSASQGTGLSLTGLAGSSTYAVQFNISKSTIQYLNVGISYGSYLQGVTVDQTNFTGNNYGIFANSGLTGSLLQLTVANSQFNCFKFGIVTSTAIGNIAVNNNLFIANGANSVGIQLVEDNDTISGNFMSGTTTTGTIGVVILTGSGGTTINDNWITGLGTGIDIVSGTGILIHNNQFGGNSANISNSGTATIFNNPGYNPVGAFGITVTASPFTYTAGSSPETVYIYSGTVSLVTVGGATACASSPCSVQLDPAKSVIVTYSVAPSMNKYIH